ncbi:MAG: response regulator [Flavipsychrobacter sp.]|nr:response regulator [Flavipsychrobacter sp.]
MNGIELRNKIFTNEEIRKKCIPYLFFTTSANKKSVTDAYAMSVYGFFIKPVSVAAFEKVLGNIIEYWKECISMNEIV